MARVASWNGVSIRFAGASIVPTPRINMLSICSLSSLSVIMSVAPAANQQHFPRLIVQTRFMVKITRQGAVYLPVLITLCDEWCDGSDGLCQLSLVAPLLHMFIPLQMCWELFRYLSSLLNLLKWKKITIKPLLCIQWENYSDFSINE